MCYRQDINEVRMFGLRRKYDSRLDANGNWKTTDNYSTSYVKDADYEFEPKKKLYTTKERKEILKQLDISLARLRGEK